MTSSIDLDHVAVAVEHHADAFSRYRGDLGGQWLSSGVGQGFAPAQLRYANGMKVEVLEPARVEVNDFLRRFLDRNGPGPHHLTFKVPDLGDTLQRAEDAGYTPINVDRRDAGWQEAFLHPRAIPGVLVQVAQTSGQMWKTPVPPGWPAPRTAEAAILEHVGHAVADLDEGRRLFVGLLQGRELAAGTDDALGGRWIDIAWPGPGRLRLLSPVGPTSPLQAWMGGRPGRVHHLAFACERPEDVGDATDRGDGWWEVTPEANLGTRLLLH